MYTCVGEVLAVMEKHVRNTVCYGETLEVGYFVYEETLPVTEKHIEEYYL